LLGSRQGVAGSLDARSARRLDEKRMQRRLRERIGKAEALEKAPISVVSTYR
jgi:hypothetical protein